MVVGRRWGRRGGGRREDMGREGRAGVPSAWNDLTLGVGVVYQWLLEAGQGRPAVLAQPPAGAPLTPAHRPWPNILHEVLLTCHLGSHVYHELSSGKNKRVSVYTYFQVKSF